jgi:hypothetical protein
MLLIHVTLLVFMCLVNMHVLCSFTNIPTYVVCSMCFLKSFGNQSWKFLTKLSRQYLDCYTYDDVSIVYCYMYIIWLWLLLLLSITTITITITITTIICTYIYIYTYRVCVCHGQKWWVFTQHVSHLLLRHEVRKADKERSVWWPSNVHQAWFPWPWKHGEQGVKIWRNHGESMDFFWGSTLDYHGSSHSKCPWSCDWARNPNVRFDSSHMEWKYAESHVLKPANSTCLVRICRTSLTI